MKKSVYSAIFLIGLFVTLVAISGCSSRSSVPFADEDQTIIYPPKSPDDISATITLCRKISKKTGKPVGAGTVFKIKEKENLRAVIDLENAFTHGNRALMFHFDWIKPDGKSLFLKPVTLSPGDSTSTISSSISIAPEVRQPGDYQLKLYYFRELIAEKKFTLVTMSDPSEDDVTATLTLCKRVDKETGEPVDIDSVFKIKKKGKLQVLANLENLPMDDDEELKFRIEWIDPKGQAFFKKRFDFVPADSIATLQSSISISPDKREPGFYSAQLYLANQLITQKQFELVK
ncbi:MAG: hypothetical protein IH598_01320 [Bacteroidales bacterium]|nr:hypothetical protein [Bacteroidales bacterium]